MPKRVKPKTPKSFASIGFNISRTYKNLPQKGQIVSAKRDKSKVALPPGKRISRTGKVYWETRKNRTDKIGSTL